jgi:hypothetical protein
MPRDMSKVLALLALLAFAAPVDAQYPGGQGGGQGGGRGGMGGSQSGPRPGAIRGPAAEVPLSPGALVQTQLDQLEDDLKLTPAQSGAWTAYADKVQALADYVERIRFDARTATPGQASATQQLEQIADGVHKRTAIVDAIVERGRTLYATLTPEQKEIADSRMWLPVSLLTTGLTPAAKSDAAGRGGRGPPQ